jgi:uncharacterized RDD family membrane protein YckC
VTSAGGDPGQLYAGEPEQIVHSPEQVALHFPVAGPTSRMLAYGIDLIFIWLLELGLVFLTLLLVPVASDLEDVVRDLLPSDTDLTNQQEVMSFMLVIVMLMLLVQLVVEWGYFTFFELAMGGRSPGKRVIGLRVMRDGGLPITLRESLLRNLLRVVDMLPSSYLIGLIAMVVSKEGKRLGDLAAGTIVVRTDAPPAPRPLPAREAGATSAFRFERAQLDKLGSAERALIRQTLRRAQEFPPEQAAAILARGVDALCARLDLAPMEPAEHREILLALLHEVRER